MRQNIFIFGSVAILSAILLSNVFSVRAQSLTDAERAQLEAQLAQVEQEEAQAQASLTTAQSKSSSLQNDINVLTDKIKTEQLDIQAKNLLIQTLGAGITQDQNQITSLGAQIASNKIDIAEMFRELDRTDAVSLPEILLSNETISGFLQDSTDIETLQNDLDALSAKLMVEEASSTVAKAALVTKQNAAVDARYTIQQEQKSLQSNQTQEKQLLTISKGNEKQFSTLVATEKTQADQINAKLFALAGGSNPIQFGQAYQYALTASKQTGVDPAFLLAILTQESNLGSNQGTCYLTNEKTGAGVSVKSGKTFSNVMNPTRDVPPFLTITSDLQVNPLQTVVSCPQSVGWGGAMGPAQFIASTWMLFTNRIANALGESGMANPWNPQDAFMASALYLSDLGAGSGGYTAEDNAACRYYSGSPCSKSALVASYGSSVMSLASSIQQNDINKLQGL